MRLHKIILTLCFSTFILGMSSAHAETVVRMSTSLGTIDVELYDDDAPITVANFLNYVRDGDYDNSFIHRSIPGFIIQGGGYTYQNGGYAQVPADPAIVNEYSASRSNLRGTIAMAKLDGNPNSATREWFFNLDNNAANLNVQNGGFTVFGRVYGSNTDSDLTNDGASMRVVDAIAALERWNGAGLDSRYDSNWSTLPLIGFSSGQTFVPTQHLVMVHSVRVVNHLERFTNHAGHNVVLTAPAPARLANIAVGGAPAASPPANVTFQEGFYSFDITNIAPGAATSVALQLPSNYRPNTYYMYGPTPDNASPHWYEFLYDGITGAEFFDNYVVLHFVDGQRGDSDLTANGQIVDPGGPGIASSTTTSSSSSSGGGCTLARPADTRGIPLDTVMLGLMMTLLAWRRVGASLRDSPSRPQRHR